MGNPFMDDFKELVALNSSNVVDESVANAICQMQPLGCAQYRAFTESVLVQGSESIQATIKKNKLPMFSIPTKRTRTKTASTVKVLKTNGALMGKMLIALQTREGNLDDFFASEI